MSYDYTRAADTAAVALDPVSQMVQLFLAQEAKLMFTCTQDMNVKKGDKTFNYPRHDGFTAENVTASTSLNAQRLTWAKDTATITKHKGVLVNLEEIADEQSIIDQLPEINKTQAAALVDALEADLYSMLAATSASAPDHRITYATSATLALGDIRSACELLDVQNVPDMDRFLAINPKQHYQLLSLGDFVDASKYGDRTALLNGEIGQIFGLRVIKSNAVTVNTSLVYHKSHVAFGFQKWLKFAVQPDLDHVSTKILMTALWGSATCDSGKRGVLINNAGS